MLRIAGDAALRPGHETVVWRWTWLRILAACFARALLFASALIEARAQGRPGAGWHPKSRVCFKKSARGGRQVMPEHPAFPARWFSRCPSCSPRGALHYCPRRLADDRCTCRLAATSPPRLDARTPGVRTTRLLRPRTSLIRIPGTGVRSPPGPNEGRCQRRVVSRLPLLTGLPRPATHIDAPTPSRPPHPGPRFVTIAKRPSWRAGCPGLYGKSEFL